MKKKQQSSAAFSFITKLLVFLAVIVFAGNAGTHLTQAQSYVYDDDDDYYYDDDNYEEYTLELKSTESISAARLAVHAVLDPYITYIDVYRADSNPAQGGAFRLIDTVKFGSWAKYGNSEYWQHDGEKKVVTAYSRDPHADNAVNYVLMDTSTYLGRTYYYKLVTEGVVYGSQISSNVISGQTKLETTDLTKCCSADGKTVKLEWYTAEKAQGYQIYRKNGKKWKKIKTITKGNTYKYTDKKVKKGKTYQYKVRAYSKVNGKTYYSSYGKIQKVALKNPTVKGSYYVGSVYGPALNNKELLQVRRVVQSFKNNYITTGMSSYQKALAAFNYLRSNCAYAWKGWQYNNANTAWGALVYGEAQCSGYARAMKALCDAIGVPCYYVHANAKAINPSHQWNEVKVGGKWYIVDAQSGAFLIGSKTWKNAGLAWNTKGLPKCSTTDYKKK